MDTKCILIIKEYFYLINYLIRKNKTKIILKDDNDKKVEKI